MTRDREYIDAFEFNNEMANCIKKKKVTENFAVLLLRLIYNIATGKKITSKIPNIHEREELTLRVIEKVLKNLMVKLKAKTIDPKKNSYAYVSLIVLGKFRDEIRRNKYCDWLGVRIRTANKDENGDEVLAKASVMYLEDYKFDIKTEEDD